MMKKRLVSVLLVLCMSVSLLSGVSLALDSGTCGDNLTWWLDDGGTLRIWGTGAMWDFSSDGGPWCAQSDRVKKVIIEDGVTSTGYYAFQGCDNLTSVEIPSSVRLIRSSTFLRCSALEEIVIPYGVTGFGSSVFAYCYNLKSISLPSGLSIIGTWAFYDCDRLTSLCLPEGVTVIGKYAFGSCDRLAELTIPASVTSIQSSIVAGCSNLKDIYYEGTAEDWEAISIDSDNDELFAKIHYGERQVSQELDLYQEFPHYLNNQFFNLVFDSCSDTVDEALENIEGARTVWAAYRHRCTEGMKMTWTTIREKLNEAMGRDGQSNYDNEVDRITLDFMKSFCSKETTALASIVQETGKEFKRIGDNYNLFYNASSENLENIATELSIASKGRYSLSESKKIVAEFSNNWDKVSAAFEEVGTAVDFLDVLLTTFLIDSVNNKTIDLLLRKVSKDSDYYDGLCRMKQRQGAGSANYFLETYLSQQVLDQLPGIVASAVGYLTQNVSISDATFALANGIISISVWAIDQLPGSVELDDIMSTMLHLNNAYTFRSAFWQDQMRFMEYIVYNKRPSEAQYVQEISEYKVVYAAMVESMRMALENAKKLTDNQARKENLDRCISMMNTWTYDLYYSMCVSDVEDTYGDVFNYTKNEQGITITGISDVMTASAALFTTEEKSTNELLAIPNEIGGIPVVAIEDSAFAGRNNFDAVIISENVETVGANSFDGCSRLNTVVMGDGVTMIEDRAFANCTALTNVSLSSNTQTIGEYTFSNCTSLSAVTIPVSTAEIKAGAFAGNTALESIKVMGKEVQIADTALEDSDQITVTALENSSAAAFAQSKNLSLMSLEPVATEIQIVKQPEQLNYFVGEEIDSKGMELQVSYSDGTSEVLTDGWILSCDISSPGEKTVYVYYEDAITMYSVSVQQLPSTVDGAQIRTTGKQGLRFISSITKGDAFCRAIEYGTLLIPSDDVSDISEVVIGAKLNGHSVAKVRADKIYEQTDTTIKFTAVLIGVPVSQYKRAITARAYAILDNGEVIYGDTYTSRSIYQVAQLGLENPNESEENKELFRGIIFEADNENGLVYPW